MISIAHWGTTDVDNYGDLLFPLILEHELKKRLTEIQVVMAAPWGGSFPADESRMVQRIVRFEEPGFYRQLDVCDALVLGGGDIFRFDEADLLNLYGTDLGSGCGRFSSLFVHDLGKLARLFPVYWNAVGVPHEFDRSKYCAVHSAVARVRYLSVRDDLSKKRLEAAGVHREIDVVPDTALLLPALFSQGDMELRIQELRSAGEFPDRGRILTFQLPLMSEPVAIEAAGALAKLNTEFPELQVALLPIGNCRNDRTMMRIVRERLGPNAFVVDRRTGIADVAAVISHSHCFAGASLHGNITAAAYGVENVPINLPEWTASKNREYARILGREDCLVENVSELYPALRALAAGNRPVDRSVLGGLRERLNVHFDRLASSIAADASKPGRACVREIDAIHAELCDALRSWAEGEAEQERAAFESRLHAAESRAQSAAKEYEQLRIVVAQREGELRRIRQSLGWRVLNKYGRIKHRLLLPTLGRLGLRTRRNA